MSTAAEAIAGPIRARASGPLTGSVRLAGDRIIAHHALVLGALALGETVLEGVPQGPDIAATAAVLRAFGATVTADRPGEIHIRGVGVGGLLEPEDVIDCGSAAAALPLLLGALASQGLAANLTGDARLRDRPLGRMLDPLRRVGAQFITRSRERLPLGVFGAEVPLPIDYRLPAPSAEAKAALLFAALNTPGVTSLVEPVPVRDHAERILGAFGAALEIDHDGEGVRIVRIEGQRDLKPQRLVLPGDPAAAGFVIVAALVVPGSDVTLENVLLNPLRSGLVDMLTGMGAAIAIDNHRIAGGEAVADLRIRSSSLTGIAVPAARAAALADDLPALAVAAAFAEGRTVFEGLGGLRLEQPGLLAGLAGALAANGVAAEEGTESLVVTGSPRPAGGGMVRAGGDHRLALATLVLGLGAAGGSAVDALPVDADAFPDFIASLTGLGASFEPMDPPAP